MPKISARGKAMPASPIRKLVPFADAAKKAGKKIFHLNIGQPDIPTPEVMLNAIKNIDFKVWAYTHSEGNLDYRQKLALYYQKHGYQVKANDIIITTGGSEAITIGMNACLDPGDEVIIPEPFYANYNGFGQNGNIKIVPVESHIQDGFALPPIAEFEKLITPRTRAIMICNPNNPTGYLYSRAELEQLRQLVIKHDLYLFSDEAYREFCYDGAEFVSPMHLDGLEEHAVVLDTVSKRYSACGARLGALITRSADLHRAALKFAQARLCPPSIGQIAAKAALDTPDSYFQEVHKEYTDRRNLLVDRLNKIPGVFCPSPKGAFYAVVSLPVKDAEHFCQWILENFDLNGSTVMMAPAAGFYSSPGLGKDQVRIAYVLNKQELSQAMDCLEAALKAYPGKTS